MKPNDPKFDVDPRQCPEHESAGLLHGTAELRSFNQLEDALDAAAKHGYSVTTSTTTYFSPPEQPVVEGEMPVDPRRTIDWSAAVGCAAARPSDEPQQVATDDEAAAPGADPHQPPRFELRDSVKFIHNNWPIKGHVISVTTYLDREAAYGVRPRWQDQHLLHHGHDVTKDEDELERD